MYVNTPLFLVSYWLFSLLVTTSSAALWFKVKPWMADLSSSPLFTEVDIEIMNRDKSFVPKDTVYPTMYTLESWMIEAKLPTVNWVMAPTLRGSKTHWHKNELGQYFKYLRLNRLLLVHLILFVPRISR
jgi:hypothetical protein